MTTFRTQLLIALVALACGPTALHAQVSVRAGILNQPNTIWPYTELDFGVYVEGTNQADAPVSVRGEGIDITGPAGTRSGITSTPAGTSSYTMFTYRATPLRSGEITIEPVEVIVDGRSYRTDPVTISVSEPVRDDGVVVELTTPRSTVYVGEPVQVDLAVLVGEEAGRNYMFLLDRQEGDYDLTVQAPPIDPKLVAAHPDYAFINLLGQRFIASRSGQRRDGRVYERYLLRLVLTARAPGPVTLGPAQFAWDNPRRQRVVSASEPLSLEVRPLPSAGRPATFTGLIGAYRIHATAQPTEVSVGDPITLYFNVTGPEPLDRVGPMSLEAQDLLTRDFKVPSEPVVPQVRNGSASFETVIRARHDGVTQIPPLELGYFDVVTGTYGVAQSEPISVTVRPTANVSISGLPPEEPEPAVEDRPGGIAPIMRGAGAASSGAFRPVEALTDPRWLGTWAGPPALYALLAGGAMAHRRRLRDPAAIRHRRALGRARRRLRQAGSADPQRVAAVVTGALCGCVADLADRPEAGLTPDEATRLVAERDADLSRQLATLLGRCDAARFGGATLTPTDTVRQEAMDLLNRIAGAIRRRA